jgi:hypothetical protein
MRLEDQLKLQAYLDEELSEHERRAVASWLAKDPEAQALLAELQAAKITLASNEPEIQLPESREFYWSKIVREIDRLETVGDNGRLPFLVWLKRKYWVPVGALAILTLLALVSSQLIDWSDLRASTHLAREGESPAEEIGSMTFRSEADRVTIIWLYDRTPEIASDFE